MNLPTPMYTHTQENFLLPIPRPLPPILFVSEPILKGKVTVALLWPSDNAFGET